MAGYELTDVVISSMRPDDLAFAIDHAAQEGWNPGRSDAQTFHAADPGGFWVAKLADRPIGCISAVRYGESFGFIGLFIVLEEFRARGVGRRLWAAAASHVQGRVIGLDGVVEMQATYAAAGFALAHRNVRYQGGVDVTGRRQLHARPLRPADVLAVHEYDRVCFGAPRDAFLQAWLSQPGAVVRVLDGESGLAGFAVGRPCRRGYKVGPLFADGLEEASALLDAVAAALPAGTSLVVDIPEPNAQAQELVSSRNMSPVFETARMYAGGEHVLPLRRVFGITSFELG